VAVQDFNALDFGAKGDGVTDDTLALQTALDRTGEAQGQLYLPAGCYKTGKLNIPPHITVKGVAATGYRTNGGTVLQLNNEQDDCLLDITAAKRARLEGLNLDGSLCREQVHHGVMCRVYDHGKTPGGNEDFFVLENMRIGEFSGDGVHLESAWAWSIRSCVIFKNDGCGILCSRGSDAFVLDNQLSANGRAGWACYDHVSSMTFTGNRIEWNGRLHSGGGGFVLNSGAFFNLGNNYFDRSFGPNIAIIGNEISRAGGISITGNVIFRGGNPTGRALADWEKCNVLLDFAAGVTMTGNTLMAGQNDSDMDGQSPDFAIRVKSLENSVITGNTLHKAALRKLIDDHGGHNGEIVIENNPGSLWENPSDYIWFSI
jgi:hypothetical protein